MGGGGFSVAGLEDDKSERDSFLVGVFDLKGTDVWVSRQGMSAGLIAPLIQRSGNLVS